MLLQVRKFVFRNNGSVTLRLRRQDSCCAFGGRADCSLLLQLGWQKSVFHGAKLKTRRLVRESARSATGGGTDSCSGLQVSFFRKSETQIQRLRLGDGCCAFGGGRNCCSRLPGSVRFSATANHRLGPSCEKMLVLCSARRRLLPHVAEFVLPQRQMTNQKPSVPCE